jgi:hypothetical protein
MRPQYLIAAVQRGAEHLLRFIEAASHVWILRALAGEQKRDFRFTAGLDLARSTRRGLGLRKAVSLSRAMDADSATTASRSLKCGRPAFAVKQMSGQFAGGASKESL